MMRAAASEVKEANRKVVPKAWQRLLRLAFIIACAAAAAIILRQEWNEIGAALKKANFALLSLALIASSINIFWTGLSWRALLVDGPVRLSWQQAAKIFFIGQIGKYLPGTIWSFLASAELAKNVGIPRKTAVSSLLLALILGLGSGVILVVLTLPSALNMIELSWYLALPALLVPMMMAWPKANQWLLKRAGIDFQISVRSLILSTGAAAAGWLFAGAKIALISNAIGVDASWIFVAQATGIYALAWIAGLLFFIAPAGLGAREGVLITLLAVHMPLADAVVVALLSRLAMTLSDFFLAGLAGTLSSVSLRPIEQVGE